MPPQVRPFGLWHSPIQPQDLAHSKNFKDVAWDADGKRLVWLEGRGPRGVLVCQTPHQAPRDLNTTLSVRAQVGYGGGDFTLAHGWAYFAESGGGLYRQNLDGGPPQPLTPAFGNAASPTVSRDGRWVVYVHRDASVDRLAIVDSAGAFWPQHLAAGADFYMQPAWHPGGRRLAWVEWNHPHMPWDSTRLLLGTLSLDRHRLPRLSASTPLAGDLNTALSQPEFSPDGRYLAYISDQRGWSNLWLYDLERESHSCLTEDQFDIGLPTWVQGLRVYSFSADGKRLFFARSQAGSRRLWQYDMGSKTIAPVSQLADYDCVEQITAAPRGKGLAAIASSSKVGARILRCTDRQVYIHARATSEHVPAAELAQPESVSWASAAGDEIQGIFYPPTNPSYRGDGQPPALVMIHGGPTGQTSTGFESRNQFFATRGYAVLDVDYRGSTGHGRKYMDSLRGNWGVADVEDALSAGRYLIAKGRADGDRIAIMGGSAGGYTVLRTLTLHPGVFRAGICLYGISNLFTLAMDTHKFEAHYLDSLLGPLPEASALYRERSPIFSLDELCDPLAIFQGADDKVVPLEQAESIVESLRRRNVPHEYHLYQGEGHGWRKPETIVAFYQAVEKFLQRYVLFA